MKTTINDVAKEAGVSKATVSRVINNNYPVSIATREKVEKAIEKLNFSPNYVAKSLSEKKTYVIGVLVPSINNLYFTEIVTELEKHIVKKNYTINLLSFDSNWEYEKIHLINMQNRQVDGLIIMDSSASKKEDFNFLNSIAKNIPMVMINGQYFNVKTSAIVSNEEKGAIEALNYLYHTTEGDIAIVTGEKSYSYKIKEKVYLDFLKEKNIKNKNILKISSGNSLETISQARETFIKYYRENSNIKSIFAFNDLIAIGILEACKNLKLKIPEDLSIISYDNTILSSIASVKLSSVDLKLNKIGLEAYKLIYKLLNSEKEKNKIVKVDTNLIIRDSTF